MGILNGLLGRGRKASPTAAHPLLEHVSAVLGDEILAAPDFATTLIPALDHADAFLRNQIGAIPGPLALSSAARNTDPLMSRLFAGDEDLRAGLGRSLEAKESIVQMAVAGHVHTYAMLGMRLKRGVEPAPGEAPIFADHTVKALSHTEAGARDALRIAALRRIIKNFDQHLAKLREKQQLLRVEWNIENNPAGKADGNEFVQAKTELTPGNMVRGLAAWLRRPEEVIRLSSGEIRIPGRSPDGAQAGHYELPMLHCADRRQWIVCMVAFPTYEAAEALKAESRIHRYIFI
jgi:hypothetical protein